MMAGARALTNSKPWLGSSDHGKAIQHGSFTVERRYSAPPAMVFAGFAQAEARRKWLVYAEGWTIHEYRPAEPTVPGAVEFSRFSPPGSGRRSHERHDLAARQ